MSDGLWAIDALGANSLEGKRPLQEDKKPWVDYQVEIQNLNKYNNSTTANSPTQKQRFTALKQRVNSDSITEELRQSTGGNSHTKHFLLLSLDNDQLTNCLLSKGHKQQTQRNIQSDAPRKCTL